MVEIFFEYMAFYKKYAVNWWDHIGPKEYVILLSLVGILGYLLMLKKPKRLA